MRVDTSRYAPLLLAIWLLLLLSHTQGQAQSAKRDAYRQQFNKVYGATEIVADVEHFYLALQSAHPDLYRYLPKPQLDSMVDALKDKAGQLTLRQFYNELSMIGANIGCGHLVLSYPKGQERYFIKQAYYPPLHLEVYDSIVVVKKNLLGKENYDHAVVRSINGVPIDSLVAGINRFLAHDGYSLAGNTWLLETGWFNELFIRYWADSSTYTYQLEMLTDSGWVNHQTTLPGYDYKTMKLPRKKRQKPQPQLTLKYDEDTRTAILTLKTFDPKAIARGKQKFNKFVREAFWRIQQLEAEQVVIDLRDNEGGNSFYPEILIAYLSKEPFRLYRNMEIRHRSATNAEPLVKVKGKRAYKKLEKHSSTSKNGNMQLRQFTERYVPGFPMAYEGTVYVMVNGGTYSAASELACYLKEHVTAIVVGSETGGSCDQVTAGMYGVAELPNTGIVVNIPLIAFEKDIKRPRQAGCGLKPDLPQHIRPNDSIADPEMEYLLETIGQKTIK